LCVTSAGDNASWHLPSINFFTWLNNTSPVTHTVHTGGTGRVFLQGFYFTNLQQFTSRGKTYDDIAEANRLYLHRENTAYVYNVPGYIVSLKVDNSVNTESKFDFYKIAKDATGKYVKIFSSSYFCHTK